MEVDKFHDPKNTPGPHDVGTCWDQLRNHFAYHLKRTLKSMGIDMDNLKKGIEEEGY